MEGKKGSKSLQKRISEGALTREDVARRLAELAFGRANDCVKLVLEEDLTVPERRRYADFFNHNAEVLHEQGTGTDYLYGGNWARPGHIGCDLNAQTSACAMIEAKAYYEIMLDKQKK